LITIDQFAQIEMRVGQIVLAERVANADKLLRLEVDLAEPTPRQILSGIAEWYAPEELVGRKILVVANLQPRTMRGLESRGMLLAASAGDGRPLLATVPSETPNGTRLR
jgi:methionyl-tRNA synthetase